MFLQESYSTKAVDDLTLYFVVEESSSVVSTGLQTTIPITSLVPRPHPFTRRNGLVNQVKFLGLAGALATV